MAKFLSKHFGKLALMTAAAKSLAKFSIPNHSF